MKKNITDSLILEEATRLVNEGTNVVLKVKGTSMLPFIVGGRDSVVLTKVGKPSVGDVVLALCDNGHYVLHRIIKTDDAGVTLMGDGNIRGTEHCSYKNVKALATHVVKGDDGEQRPLYSKGMLRASRIWWKLRPIRRYILAIYRRI